MKNLQVFCLYLGKGGGTESEIRGQGFLEQWCAGWMSTVRLPAMASDGTSPGAVNSTGHLVGVCLKQLRRIVFGRVSRQNQLAHKDLCFCAEKEPLKPASPKGAPLFFMEIAGRQARHVAVQRRGLRDAHAKDHGASSTPA